MAINTQEQKQLVQLVIGMLGIAPGSTYLPVVEQAFQDLGSNWADAANALASLPVFKQMYPAHLTAEAFASRFLGSLGLQNDTGLHSLAAQLMKDGLPPAQLILLAVTALVSTTAGPYASARALLENKVTVALYHSQILGRTDTDFDTLRKVLDKVTSDPASVDVAKQSLAPLPEPSDPAPVFSATKDTGGTVSFTTFGTQITVTEAGGNYTFTSSGGNAGTAMVAGPISSITVPAGTSLRIDTALAPGIAYSGTGKVYALADAAGADLSAFAVAGVHGLELTAGQNYTLTAAQAGTARLGAAGTPGALADAGTITAKGTLAALGGGLAAALKGQGVDQVIATEASGADLSALAVAGVDRIVLTVGQNYTLSPEQAAVSQFGATGNPGDLLDHGLVIVRGALSALDQATASALRAAGADGLDATVAAGADLRSADLTGINTLLLASGQNYTLTAAQAVISRFGAAGTHGSPGALVDAGTVTVVDTLARLLQVNPGAQKALGVDTVLATVAVGANISSESMSDIDGLILTSGQNYTLTAAQATIGRIGAAGAVGALTDAGTITVTDSLAALGASVATSLKVHGVDQVIATAATGADLTATSVAGIDSLVLTQSNNYTLSVQQAAIARMGSAGATGVLTDAGTIIVKDTVAALAGGVASTLKTQGVDLVTAVVPTGIDVSAMDLSGIDGLEVQGAITMTAAQHNAMPSLTGASSVTLSGLGSLTARAGVGSYILSPTGSVVIASAGADHFQGGSGHEIFVYNSPADAIGDTVDGGSDGLPNYVNFRGVTGETFLVTNGFQNIGRYFADQSTSLTSLNLDASAYTLGGVDLTGNAGANRLTGTEFKDWLWGFGGGDAIRGRGGDDSLYLLDQATVVFEATASSNGVDALSEVGATTKLDFSAFLPSARTLAPAVDANSATSDLVLTSANIGVRTGKSALAAGDVVTAGDPAVAGQVVMADNGKAVVVSGSGTDVSIYYVWDTDAGTGQTFAVALVGTARGLDVSQYAAGNFV